MIKPAIETHNLCKVFNGDKVAVADLSLRVERGEVFGFLGPNGAGKTTSVKMLLGLISPTSGTGSLLNALLGNHQARSKVGFLPEHFRFHQWLTAAEFLTLHADLYQMERSRTQKRVPEILNRVGLTRHTDKKLSAFSKGMLQRVGLAQALLNEPDLVILDEPTSGLDPVGRRMVRDIIKDLRQQGTTVFLNSHFLSEVEVTCDRVAFIRQGEIVVESTMHDLLQAKTVVRIEAQPREGENQGRWQRVLDGLRQWGQPVQVNTHQIHLPVAELSVIPQINRYLVSQDVDVFAIAPHTVSLEDLFMQIIERGNLL